MGSIFSPRTPTPPAPPPPATYRDEIGGTEQVPVRNSDGTTTYVTRRLPLTPEQESERKAYRQMMQDALSEIETLSSSDYALDEGSKSILDAWESERQSLLNEGFEERESFEERSLARRGLGSSSAADAVRRERLSDRKEARRQLSNERTLLKEDVREKNLSYQQNLYNLAAGQENMDEVRALQSASQGVSAVNAVNASNRASISDYYNRQMAATRRDTGRNNQMISLLGAGVGGALGGPTGAMIGGSLFQTGGGY